jgi:virulence-associated protein VagC
VRLPKEFWFDGDEVLVTKLDDMVILYPAEKGWDLMQRAIGRFTEDFMADRNQPAKAEVRKSLDVVRHAKSSRKHHSTR